MALRPGNPMGFEPESSMLSRFEDRGGGMVIALKNKLSTKHFHVILDEANDGVLVFDESGLILRVNDTLCRMIDFPMDEIVGKKIYDLLSVKNKRAYWKKLGKWDGSRRDNYEFPVLTGTGRKLDILMSAIPVHLSKTGQREFLATLIDISKYKKIERALKKREKELEVILNNCNYSSKNIQKKQKKT